MIVQIDSWVGWGMVVVGVVGSMGGLVSMVWLVVGWLRYYRRN